MKHSRFYLYRCSWRTFPIIRKRFFWIVWGCLTAHSMFAQKEEEFCNFSNNVSINCNDVTVRFTAPSNMGPYTWNFGDGTPPVTGNPPINHTYLDVNPYLSPINVTLIIPGDTCTKVVEFLDIFVGSGCGSNRTLSSLLAQNKLPATELVGKTLYVFGNLEVDIPYIFDGCTILVSAGGKIIIKSGGTLMLKNNTIVDAHVISGGLCQNLWNGFEVQPGGTLATNGAIIQNAYYAINLSNPTNISPLPNVSLMNTTFRRNFVGIYAAAGNFVFTKFSNNTFEGLGNNAIYPVGNCNPPNPISGITYAQRTYCGIYFDGSTGGRLLLYGQSVNNVFKDLQAGIVCQNGNVNIRSCSFENIRYLQSNTATYQGTAFTFIDNIGGKKLVFTGLGKVGVPTVNNCERGFYIKTTKLGTDASVSAARMEEVQNGVEFDEAGVGNFSSGTVYDCYIGCTNYLSNIKKRTTGIEIKDPNISYSNFNITGNDIDVVQPEAFSPLNYVDLTIIPMGVNVVAMHNQASNNAILVSIADNHINVIRGIHGILVENVSNAGIYGNTVITSTDSGDEFASIGVIGGINNKVSCNTVSATAQGQNSVYVGVGCTASPNILIERNSMNDMSVGIAFHDDNETNCFVSYNDMSTINNTFTVGVSYNDSQSGPQYLQGNDWLEDFVLGAFFSQVAGGFPYCNSLYHVSNDANVANSSNPVIVTISENCDDIPGDDSWFTVLEDIEDDFTCASNPGGSSGALAKNEADLNLAGGGTTTLSPGYGWSSEMGLIRKFTENPGLATGDAIINSFLQAQNGQPVKRTFEIRNGIDGLEGSLSSVLSNNINSTLLLLESKNAAQLDLLDDFEVVPNALSTFTTLAGEATALEYVLQSYLALALSARALNAAVINSANDTINCTSLPCTAEKYLNGLYLETQLLTPRSLTSSELAAVEEIGLNCPGDAGNIVYLARTWYYLETGTALNAACGSFVPASLLEERSQQAHTKATVDLGLMPNPANGSVTATLPPIPQGGIIQIMDMMGNIILVHKIHASDTSSTLSITTEGFANGMYIVSLIDNTGNPASKKLTIHH